MPPPAAPSPPLVLFTYPETVVGRRMEWYLTLRGIRYSTCRVDSKMPRPVLARLGVHYRRIPVLAIGRDIYCDSRCIIAQLEQLWTGSGPRLGADARSSPHAHGLERILESWVFDGGVFARTAQMIPPEAALMLSKEWVADREELTGLRFEPASMSANLPDALAHARANLSLVEDCLLADGRGFLGGAASPGLADVHLLWIFDWMMRPAERMGMASAYPDFLNDKNYPRTIAWAERMEALFQSLRAKNPPTELSADQAVDLIERSALFEPDSLPVDERDPSGLKRGDEADLIALDSTPQTGIRRRDVGRLAGLTLTRAAVETKTARGVDVRIHYPRTNVRVARASGAPRLSANEGPPSSKL